MSHKRGKEFGSGKNMQHLECFSSLDFLPFKTYLINHQMDLST